MAYWGLEGSEVGGSGHRDVWIIPVQGGAPVAITNDAAVDWQRRGRPTIGCCTF